MSLRKLKRNKARNLLSPRRREAGPRRACELCGRTGRLTQTECCGHWICDDEHLYVPFTYEATSCRRSHRRYTVCGHHAVEGHEGSWQACEQCRNGLGPTELYVYYATNEFNFEPLQSPPEFEPTYCADCGRRVRLGFEAFSVFEGEPRCEACFELRPPDVGGAGPG